MHFVTGPDRWRSVRTLGAAFTAGSYGAAVAVLSELGCAIAKIATRP